MLATMERDESMEMEDDEFEAYLKFLKTMLDRMQADGSLDQWHCHVTEPKSHECRRYRLAQAAAVAVCQSLIATPRNWRNVLREVLSH